MRSVQTGGGLRPRLRLRLLLLSLLWHGSWFWLLAGQLARRCQALQQAGGCMAATAALTSVVATCLQQAHTAAAAAPLLTCSQYAASAFTVAVTDLIFKGHSRRARATCSVSWNRRWGWGCRGGGGRWQGGGMSSLLAISMSAWQQQPLSRVAAVPVTDTLTASHDCGRQVAGCTPWAAASGTACCTAVPSQRPAATQHACAADQ